MPSLFDEVTGSKGADLLSATGDALQKVAKNAATSAGRSLVDEVGARTGIAVPILGPEGKASLNVPRGGGTAGVEAPNARNIAQSKGGIMDTVMAYWKPLAALAVVGVIWFVMKRKK